MAETPIKAGVMGWPVSHSLSPALHGYWLKKYAIEGSYDTFPVKPEDLQQALRTLPEQGITGVNLTLPHKEMALDIVDECDDIASIIGAANTLVCRNDGSLWATNTDAFGFAESLKQTVGSERAGKKEAALVLGAGGAARAVVFALSQLGKSPIYISNRTSEKSVLLVQSMPGDLYPVAWDKKEDMLPEVGMVVNTTSLGMAGQPPLQISLDGLPSGSMVADIVYKPLMTPLLLQAEKKGFSVIDGLGMLMHQAREGFRLWFSRDPEVDEELRGHLLQTLEAQP